MLPLVKSYYTARASAAPITFGEASTGNVQIAVEFQIEDHPEFAGETITWLGHFTDATSERTIESLQIAGWSGEDVSELAGVPGSQALSDVVSLACDVDTYGDRSTLKVNWVNKPRSNFTFKQEAAPDQLRALGARLRATVKSVRASGGAARKPTGSRPQQPRSGGGGGYASQSRHPNAPGGGPDDDIPFCSSDPCTDADPIAGMIRGV